MYARYVLCFGPALTNFANIGVILTQAYIQLLYRALHLLSTAPRVKKTKYAYMYNMYLFLGPALTNFANIGPYPSASQSSTLVSCFASTQYRSEGEEDKVCIYVRYVPLFRPSTYKFR